MTLTAPGCGMGGVIAPDAEQKIRDVPGVLDVHVEVVGPDLEPEHDERCRPPSVGLDVSPRLAFLG